MKQVFFLVVGLVAAPIISHSQDHQIWIAGVGFGQAFGVNEAATHPFEPVFRAEAVAFNSIVPDISPEFGISIFTIRSTGTSGAYDYRTQIIAPDLRFRFSPLTTLSWFPYVYGGVGMAIFKVLTIPSSASPAASLSNAAPFLTTGIGISHQIMEKIGVDLNVGPAIALSDDINPVHDGKDDGWWSGVLSIYWIF